MLSEFKEPPSSLLELWKPGALVLVPTALIIKQPDLETGIVFMEFTFGMLSWTGVSWPLLVLAASPVVSLVVWEKMALYQKRRLLVFIKPDIDRRMAAYHVIHPQIATGSGGLFGKGSR